MTSCWSHIPFYVPHGCAYIVGVIGFCYSSVYRRAVASLFLVCATVLCSTLICLITVHPPCLFQFNSSDSRSFKSVGSAIENCKCIFTDPSRIGNFVQCMSICRECPCAL